MSNCSGDKATHVNTTTNDDNKRIGSSSILSEYCPIQLVVMYLLALISSQLQAHQHT